MLKAGCVIAVETASFFEEFGKPDETLYAGKRPVWKYKKDTYELYAIHSGAGEIFASMAAQLLISTYKIDMLFNFGVVGGLNESMALEKMCVVKEVVHYEFDTSEILFVFYILLKVQGPNWKRSLKSVLNSTI